MSGLPMWTIYHSPKDFPGRYVARLWLVGGGSPEPKPTDRFVTSNSLDGVRAMLPPGLTCLQRSDDDDPVIVETWL
jgi:hypothetical protein